MNAKEARDKSTSITEGRTGEQYRKIMEKIKNAVNEGKFDAHYFTSLLPGTRKALENDGYIVKEFHDQRDGTTITISW